jgi:UDPglucose 6-dehydrogenase
MLKAVLDINHDQRMLIVDKVVTLLGSVRGATIGVLGLAFKPNTDDMRDAPAIDIIHALTAQGAQVQAYDPVAKETGRAAIGEERVNYVADAYAAAAGADALIIVTHWNEFKALNPTKLHAVMRHPIIVDGRNIYQPETMARAGFIYRGIGRTTPAIDVEVTKNSLISQRQQLGENGAKPKRAPRAKTEAR